MRQQDAPATNATDGATLRTVPERAEQGRLSTRTIWKLIARGELKATRIGRSVRISDAQWAAFLANCRSEVR